MAPCRFLLASFILLVAVHAADKKQAKLVREFKRNKPDLVDISPDGRWLLLKGQRSTKCEFKEGCITPALTVYDIATGRMVDEITDVFYAPGFENGSVRTIRVRSVKDGNDEDVLWRPGNGETVLGSYAPRSSILDACRDGSNVIALLGAPHLVSLQESRTLSSPPVRYQSGFEEHCTTWRGKSALLLPGAESDETLYWVSTQPEIPFQPCSNFSPEKLLGYAVSPDGSLVVVLTGEGERPETPGYITRMTVMAAADCRTLRRTQLAIPEKPEQRQQLFSPHEKYWNNVPFSSLFMSFVSISPNNKLVAFAYGIWKDPNAVSKVGLYSLDSGDWLTTIQTDSQRCAIIRHMDANWCDSPSTGPIRFSPDSRTLFTSSEHVQQWDISAFH